MKTSANCKLSSLLSLLSFLTDRFCVFPRRGHFCVGGVKSPCPAGRFGNRLGLSSAECSGLCPPGHYCPIGSINGTFLRCPAGRYGATPGLHDSSCTDRCSAGYHCYEASTSPTQLQCAIVHQEFVGDFSQWNLFNNFNESIFPNNGNLTDFYRSRQVYLEHFQTVLYTDRITNRIRFQLIQPNSVYCPIGTSIPLTVLPGYYTTGFNASTRSDQSICPVGSYCVHGVRISCPGGTYGDQLGLYNETCTGRCSRGFYCPAGSTSSRQFPCPIGKHTSLRMIIISPISLLFQVATGVKKV